MLIVEFRLGRMFKRLGGASPPRGGRSFASAFPLRFLFPFRGVRSFMFFPGCVFGRSIRAALFETGAGSRLGIGSIAGACVAFLI